MSNSDIIAISSSGVPRPASDFSTLMIGGPTASNVDIVTLGTKRLSVNNSNVDVIGNASINGYIAASNMGPMRNRILNGDMRLDYINGGAGMGVVASTTSGSSNVANSINGFEAVVGPSSGALCAQQIDLTPADRVAIGGITDKAVQISGLPTAGMIAWLPFENSTTDQSGAGLLGTASPTGTTVYSGVARVGDRSLDLTANTAGSSTITNALMYASQQLPSTVSVAFWMLASSVTSSDFQFMICFASTTYWALQVGLDTTGKIAMWSNLNNVAVFSTSTSSLTSNQWNHIVVTVEPGKSQQIYVNGSLLVSTAVGQGQFTGNFSSGNITQLAVGYQQDGSGVRQRAFKGLIDDVRIYNRALTPSEVSALANFTGIPPSPSTSNMTARLAFDGSLTDSLGLLTNPVMTGTTVYTPNCKSGTSALDLTANVAQTTFNVGVAYTASPVLPLSMSVWVRPSVTNVNFQMIASFGGAALDSSWAYSIVINSASQIYVDACLGGVSTYGIAGSSATFIAANTWTHIATTIQNNGLHVLYINGVQVGVTSTLGVSSPLNCINNTAITTFKLGTRGDGTANPYQGLIDDVRMYNTALPPTQVAGLYYSYSPNGYTLYRQPIDSKNLVDLAWGTSVAQPATLSAWIKNNSSVAQQYALSLNNISPSLVAYLPFDGNVSDVFGSILTGPIQVGTPQYSSATIKVGTQSLYLANESNVIATPTKASNRLQYAYTSTGTLTVSCWINFSKLPQAAGTFSVPMHFGVSGAEYLQIIGTYGSATQVSLYSWAGWPTPEILLNANSWYHVAIVYVAASYLTLYVNGKMVGITTTVNSVSGNMLLTIGDSTTAVQRPFAGYLDDLQIYQRALTLADIAGIYNANVSSTATSMPKSIVYPTPSIPANSWQKVSVTIPGDTTGYWSNTAYAALCLGAGSNLSTSNTAVASNNTSNVWNTLPEYTSTNVQVYNGSSNNVLALPGSSVTLTGVQLEKGNVGTPYENRNIALEAISSAVSVDNTGRMHLNVRGTFVNFIPLHGLEFFWDPASTLSYPGTGTVLDDASGVTSRIMRGTLTNGPTFTNISAFGNGAFYLDGVDDSIDTNGSFELRRDWTIIMWVKKIALLDDNRLFGQGTAATSVGLHVLTYDSGASLRFGFNGNDVDTGRAAGYVNTTDWQQLAFTYRHSNGLNRQLYQSGNLVLDWKAGLNNGVDTATAANAAYAGTGILRFGTIYSSGSYSSRQYMGVVQFYNRVLTRYEVDQNYQYFRQRYGV